MPYIADNLREKLDPKLDELVRALDSVYFKDGTVNYVIFRMILTWFKRSPSYSTIQDIEGTLGAVAKEFYLRYAVPYEESKKLQHGDIVAVSHVNNEE